MFLKVPHWTGSQGVCGGRAGVSSCENPSSSWRSEKSEALLSFGVLGFWAPTYACEEHGGARAGLQKSL